MFFKCETLVVYIENRDGNANVKVGQAETLKHAYKLLISQGVGINRSRMDAGSYTKLTCICRM